MYFLIGLILLVGIVGCKNSFRLTPTNMPNATSNTVSTLLPSLTQPPTLTHTPEPSRTYAIEPTRTDAATPTPLPLGQVQAWLTTMVKDNGGCRLPCWWGIIPGKTSWDDTQSFLMPYASMIKVLGSQNDFTAGVWFDNPPVEISSSRIYLGFGVKSGVIQDIAVNGIDYRLMDLMKAYGAPSEVFVDAYSSWANDDGPRHVAIHVFYKDLGILAQYDAPDGEIQKGLVHNCIKYGPLLELWNPELALNYPDALKRLGLDFQFPFLPASEALA